MPIINIAGNVISMPDSGQDPNWSEAINQFAAVVADSINAVSGAGDVLPNFFTIDALNPGTSVNVPGFTFDTAIVRSTEIKYAVIRQRDATTLLEEGTINAVYNPNGTIGSKWEASREFTGDAQISFYITDVGQVQITTQTVAGVGSHTGKLSFSAKSLLQS